LIDRILRLASNPGDVVLDAFAGTGTTAFVARRLDRRFIAIEQDDKYLIVADRRLREPRSSWQRAQDRMRRTVVSKRALQIELQRLAKMLGRLPSKRDVEMFSKHPLATFEEIFHSWGAALKAAKNIASDSPHLALAPEQTCQLEIFESAQSVERSLELSTEEAPGETILRDEREPFDHRIIRG
jgi:hypothetical protein